MSEVTTKERTLADLRTGVEGAIMHNTSESNKLTDALVKLEKAELLKLEVIELLDQKVVSTLTKEQLVQYMEEPESFEEELEAFGWRRRSW